MRYIITSLLKLLLFWFLFFAFERAFFLLYYYQLITADGISFIEAMSVFYNALKLDLATACYLLTVPAFLIFVNEVHPKKWIKHALRIYMLFILIIYSLIASAEMGLYAEWKTKLSYKALTYLQHPTEIFNSVSTKEFATLVLLWWAKAAVGYFVYVRFFEQKVGNKHGNTWPSVLITLLLLPMLLVGARGGLSAIPISVSSVYFSKHNILNLSAVNPFYNIVFSVLNSCSLDKENIFKSMPDEEAQAIVKDLHAIEKDSTVFILNTKTPNIVIVLLESWSADLVESLGGEPGITPNFRALEKDGLLFTRFYANANRSQQAIASIFAGVPGIPITTITNHPEKYASLPSIVADLRTKNYFSSFYFGGQLNYGNILSYLTYNNLDLIVEGKDLPTNLLRGKLGVHDGAMLPYVADALDNQPQPFFSTVFTLSSHGPYDVPMKDTIHWPKLEKEFVNSAFYSDIALGAFFEKVKQKPWYSTTLFVVMADHSHSTYRNYPVETVEYHHIPLLLYGPALKDSLRGRTFDLLCGNTDVMGTLLKQLDLPTEKYFWSKNVFNPYYKPFAYFELIDGLGWIRPEGYFTWDKTNSRFYQKQVEAANEEKIVQEGKAYLQVLFGEFLNY